MTSSDISNRLDKAGFLRKVAGDDHKRVAEAILAARRNHRGILLSGPCGTGKTCAAKAYRSVFNTRFFVSCSNPANVEWLDLRDPDCSGQFLTGDFILDDFGAERPRNDFGVLAEPVADFLVFLHASGRMTASPVLTTNLTSLEIASRYGQRVISRFKELFVICPLHGEDRRKIITV